MARGEVLAPEQRGDELLQLGDMHSVVFLFWEKTWGAAVNKRALAWFGGTGLKKKQRAPHGMWCPLLHITEKLVQGYAGGD